MCVQAGFPGWITDDRDSLNQPSRQEICKESSGAAVVSLHPHAPFVIPMSLICAKLS